MFLAMCILFTVVGTILLWIAVLVIYLVLKGQSNVTTPVTKQPQAQKQPVQNIPVQNNTDDLYIQRSPEFYVMSSLASGPNIFADEDTVTKYNRERAQLEETEEEEERRKKLEEERRREEEEEEEKNRKKREEEEEEEEWERNQWYTH